VPKYWKSSKITVIFKKGDKQLPENYRPICITPILYRLYSKILLKRIHDKLEAAQSRDQAGFRSTFGCLDHIFTLAQVAEKANEHGIPLWIAVIDFKKAFDSVTHAAIWEALAEQGVDAEYIQMLQRLYEGQEAVVQTDAKSNAFPINKGAKEFTEEEILRIANVELLADAGRPSWQDNIKSDDEDIRSAMSTRQLEDDDDFRPLINQNIRDLEIGYQQRFKNLGVRSNFYKKDERTPTESVFEQMGVRKPNTHDSTCVYMPQQFRLAVSQEMRSRSHGESEHHGEQVRVQPPWRSSWRRT
jgi:hypothetical protein